MREPLGYRGASLASAVVALIVVLAAVAPAAAASAPGPLPVALGSRFVGNLSAPGLVAGSSGSLGLTLSDPLPVPLTTISLELEVYAFNGFPGNATSESGLADPPVLTTATTAGGSAFYNFTSLGSGGRVAESPGVITSSATPLGAYAIRVALTFSVPNGTSYLLESRGWFSNAAWENATQGPNGTTVLDSHSLAVLGVSGVLPETSVQVTSSALSIALYVILGIAFVLTGLAGYLYYRRTSRSNSGTR